MLLNKKEMIKRIALFLIISLSLINCDKKKTSISGKVINSATGEGVYNVLISYVQCKSNGDNCSEIVIGQCYTDQSGEFIIDKKVAAKSKTKWITAYKDNKKLAQKDNVGLNDKNIIIQVTL